MRILCTVPPDGSSSGLGMRSCSCRKLPFSKGSSGHCASFLAATGYHKFSLKTAVTDYLRVLDIGSLKRCCVHSGGFTVTVRLFLSVSGDSSLHRLVTSPPCSASGLCCRASCYTRPLVSLLSGPWGLLWVHSGNPG